MPRKSTDPKRARIRSGAGRKPPYKPRNKGIAPIGDRHAQSVSETLQPLINAGKLRIPRGGYILRRGRGRVIIERPD